MSADIAVLRWWPLGLTPRKQQRRRACPDEAVAGATVMTDEPGEKLSAHLAEGGHPRRRHAVTQPCISAGTLDYLELRHQGEERGQQGAVKWKTTLGTGPRLCCAVAPCFPRSHLKLESRRAALAFSRLRHRPSCGHNSRVFVRERLAHANCKHPIQPRAVSELQPVTVELTEHKP